MSETEAKPRRARVLVVDDEPQLRAAVSRSLRAAGYAVVEAATGREGIRLVRETKPDLVLLDVILPDLNGLEVCQRIKSDTELAGTFVVLLSGKRVDSDDQAEGLEKGSDGYIVRPTSSRELLARVEAMLRIQRAEAMRRAHMRELRERIKELNCLYGISKLIEQAGLSVPEVLQGTVELIPPAWQYPEVACSRIVLDDQTHQTTGFRETIWEQSRDIHVHGELAGRIEVYYLEERPEADEGPFLNEERLLLNAIAERLGRVVERMLAGEALRESETRLELAVEGSNGGMWHIALDPDDSGHTLPDQIFLTPRLKSFLGYEDEELPNSLAAWESHVLPEDLPKLRESSQKCREGQTERHELEFRIRHRDGSIRWLRTSGRVERGEDDQPLRFAGMDWDITERKQAEEALRYQPTLLRSVSDAVITTDLDFTIQSFNSAAEALYGWRAEEAVGKSVAQVVPTDYPNDRREAVLARFHEEGAWQGDVIQRHRDGRNLYVLASVTLVRDDSGHPVSVLAINRDMTERKRVEAALQRERDLAAKVMDTSPVGIAVFDRQGRMTFANSLLQQLATAVGVTTMIGRAYNDPAWQRSTTDGNPMPDEALPFAQVMSSGRPVHNIEHCIKLPGGRQLYLSSNAAPILDDSGEIDSVVVTTEDVSQRKRAETQLEEAAATAERERLARELHDAVTQSLFSVASIAEALPRVWERDQEEGRRALDELRSLTQGALAEMRAMLLELRPSALTEQKLGALLRQLTDAMMGRTRMPVTTTVVGDCAMPDDVHIALYRIAQEALNNIAKHARASEAKLSLHCQPAQVRLSIGDDGRGFDLEAAQAHQLGLAIMRERAEAIGASLQIESQPGHGTRIELHWRRPQERTR